MDTAPLSEACAKALGDKAYDKRKAAALEVEKMAADFIITKNEAQLKKLLSVLREFATSRDSNKRKGGLIGLAGVSVGLGKECDKYLDDLIAPILMSLVDQDLRVRCLAAESLYNVIKVSRSAVLPSFPGIFTSMSRLVTDPDSDVKVASELLDRLLKDIVTESSDVFDLDGFIPLLRERIYVRDSISRQFVISWISVLASVPGINMIRYLPEILDGLLIMLDDNVLGVHRLCEELLKQFLKNLRTSPKDADMPAMLSILIEQLSTKQKDSIQLTTITWIREFVQLGGNIVLPYTSGLCTAVLPCLAYDTEARRQIKDFALWINKHLMNIVAFGEENLHDKDLEKVIGVMQQFISNSPMNTKVAALKWLHLLFTHCRPRMRKYSDDLFPVLMSTLSDTSDEVVLQGLVVLSEIIISGESEIDVPLRYRKFFTNLVNMFTEDKVFLERRGKYIIRHMCILLNGEFVFETLADIVRDTPDRHFGALMVRTLNLILFSTHELYDTRNTLRNIHEPLSARLFDCLYRCWVLCPVSAISLCLLTQCYRHAAFMVEYFANLNTTVEMLMEMDKLVQLIESPIFTNLRLQLVMQKTPDAYFLAKTLYGVLMVLPQTECFHKLRNRLECVPPNWCTREIDESDTLESKAKINYNRLRDIFVKTQEEFHQQEVALRKEAATMLTGRFT